MLQFIVWWHYGKDKRNVGETFFHHKEGANSRIITSNMMIRLTSTYEDNGAWMNDMAFVKRKNRDKYTMIYNGHLIISILYAAF